MNSKETIGLRPQAETAREELSMQAEKILRTIRSLSRLTGYCFASQKVLAGYLGKSVRTLQVYLRELVDRRLLRVERDGRNHYYPVSDSRKTENPLRYAQNSAPSAENCASNAEKTAPPQTKRLYEVGAARRHRPLLRYAHRSAEDGASHEKGEEQWLRTKTLPRRDTGSRWSRNRVSENWKAPHRAGKAAGFMEDCC